MAGAAVAAPTTGVNDDAQFFSPQAVEQANLKIQSIRKEFKKDLLIETVTAVPAEMQSNLDQLGRQRFFAEWADQRAEAARLSGIYILLCKEPSHLQVRVGRQTRERAFTLADRDELVQNLLPLLKAKQFDVALAEAVDFVQQKLRGNLGHARPPGQAKPAQAKPDPPDPAQGGSPLVSWLLIGGLVLVGVWVMLAVIRAVGRAASGGSGEYGPGGAGGYGGGGGGGFGSSLLGGLFGAAAGYWLYDTFFRGSHGSAAGGPQAHGVTTPATSEPLGPGWGESFGEDTGGGADFGDGATGLAVDGGELDGDGTAFGDDFDSDGFDIGDFGGGDF
jgi:uncharacterized protein